MSRDFTLQKYRQLLNSLIKAGYEFQTFRAFIESPKERVVVLRHDVDLRNWAALRLAKLEYSFGISSTYYFRTTRQSYSPKIIRQIVKMEHEIGYHYEDLVINDGNYDKAIESFQGNLSLFREFYPVVSICMHGSSGSPYDNRDLWKKFRLEDFGLVGEPYLTVDYNKVLYLTDTGRCWDGHKVSLRDKVESNYDFSFHSTNDIIDSVNSLPDKVLITAHPEQWTNNILEWLFVKAFSIAHTLYKTLYRNKRTSRNLTVSEQKNSK